MDIKGCADVRRQGDIMIERVLSALCVTALMCGVAFASPGITLVPAEGGLACAGSLTVDGVTYNAEQLCSWAHAAADDSSAVDAEVPAALASAVLDAAMKIRQARGH
jgi:hypothetical protein